MTWWDELKSDLWGEAGTYDDEAKLYPSESEYFYGVRDGLHKAVEILEHYEKQNQEDYNGGLEHGYP